MQIKVKTLTSKAISVDVEPSDTIHNIKERISSSLGVAIDQQRLVHSGVNLNDGTTIEGCGIGDGSELNLVLRVRGGGKPRCTFSGCNAFSARIVGDCSFCGGHFCGKHRLLENHKCQGLEDCKKESHERNAERLNSEKTTVAKVN